MNVDPDTPLRGRDMVALGIDGDHWGIPLPSRRRRMLIEGVLCDVDALAFADAPFGSLSGGEQQRLLIAQALLGDPKIICSTNPSPTSICVVQMKSRRSSPALLRLAAWQSSS